MIIFSAALECLSVNFRRISVNIVANFSSEMPRYFIGRTPVRASNTAEAFSDTT